MRELNSYRGNYLAKIILNRVNLHAETPTLTGVLPTSCKVVNNIEQH